MGKVDKLPVTLDVDYSKDPRPEATIIVGDVELGLEAARKLWGELGEAIGDLETLIQK